MTVEDNMQAQVQEEKLKNLIEQPSAFKQRHVYIQKCHIELK